MWQEFKPTILFLVKFGVTYGVLTLLYGWYVSSFNGYDPPRTDGVTAAVSAQTTAILEGLGYGATQQQHPTEQSILVTVEGVESVRIFEGCNGVSMFILFTAFVIAFKGYWKRTLWFIPAGLLFIHLSNLGRLVALSLISLHYPQHMYFFHKYGFTIIIYGAVFLLWVVWVSKLHRKPKKNIAPQPNVT